MLEAAVNAGMVCDLLQSTTFDVIMCGKTGESEPRKMPVILFVLHQLLALDRYWSMENISNVIAETLTRRNAFWAEVNARLFFIVEHVLDTRLIRIAGQKLSLIQNLQSLQLVLQRRLNVCGGENDEHTAQKRKHDNVLYCDSNDSETENEDDEVAQVGAQQMPGIVPRIAYSPIVHEDLKQPCLLEATILQWVLPQFKEKGGFFLKDLCAYLNKNSKRISDLPLSRLPVSLGHKLPIIFGNKRIEYCKSRPHVRSVDGSPLIRMTMFSIMDESSRCKRRKC